MVGWAADRAAIDRVLLTVTERHARVLGAVAAPIRYALGSGKRVRGLLCIAAYRACGGTRDAGPIGAAIEIVHAYSLVHDDLPCMDDDVMRRGQPTVHVQYGVNRATVAGVTMVPLAVRAMLDACAAAGVDSPMLAMIVQRIMGASGGGGMVGGQLLDLLGESRSLSIDELETIHRGKTGALIAAAAEIGGMAAGASRRRLTALNRFGASLGLAFQIMDDVLDVTSTTAALGKTVGRDTALRKSTYPGLLGLPEARALAGRTVDDGRDALRAEGLLTEDLERFAGFVVERAS
jgi:geranylgeranyl diphosphate synthase, type II